MDGWALFMNRVKESPIVPLGLRYIVGVESIVEDSEQ